MIRYTLNGSTPSETAGTLYSGPITITSLTTINAIAYASGMADSAVASAAYAVSCISNLTGRGIPPVLVVRKSLWRGALRPMLQHTTYCAARFDGGPYTLVGNTNLTGYRDGGDGLVANTTYYYVVQPLEGSTEICQSNQAAIAIP